jgi:DNA-binding MarR family transcriptional regulator/N-acetylglutamate synthase-like GNAT family acetyltransferase
MPDVVDRNPHLFLGSRLKRLAEQMQADANAFTQRLGLVVPAGLFSVLATLEEAGPQTVTALAAALGISQPSMTKNLGKLIEARLIRLGKGEIDRRQSVVELTTEGHAALSAGREHVWPLVDAAVQELTHDLAGSFVGQLDEIERRMAERSLGERAAAKAPMALRAAQDADVPAIVRLLNQAYRSTGADASWCVEAPYIDGDRTSESLLREEMVAKPEASMLIWKLWNGVHGCVWLEPRGEGAWYLGSLAISPWLQNAKAGRRLLAASEDWVRARGGRSIRMTVVHVRDTLIAWYQRRGYHLTGETEPFPYGDDRFGTPKRPDLHFVVLAKDLGER